MTRSLVGLVWLLMALVLPAGGSAGERLSAADRAAIRGVIEAQLAAFRADDGLRAFGFASPSIQRQFGSPANFLAMVRTGYRPVHRPREVQFRDLVEVEGEPVQLVLLVGPDFEVVTAHYVMQRQADGSWRINGCVLQAAPDQAT
ncbi:MAG TPA: DUF4864 domain-containing protein [Geminicoccaceae bacterium]|nr:DUF4864 domain-containing protein [Geminicoccaceae bacterium]